ncbi:MAG TPA: hypothetical protein VN224_05905 [Xanthomonadales bacterium]|nr:hypothetical protein [Xanthomonadales bacterium]
MVRALAATAIVVAVALAIVAAQNVAVATYVPHLGRLATDFSPAFLRREVDALAVRPHDAVFFGDSVLWGYRLPADRTAVAILAARGCACTNLAFKSGNPPNDYALARVFHASGVRPRVVVVEVNQKVFNEADPEYRTLHPGVAALADAYLTSADRALLDVPRASDGIRGRLDGALARVWLLYAMRADIREMLYHDGDPPAPRVTAAMYEGTYDLSPLTASNTGVRYLERTVESLRADGIPVVAFLTPTNHALLHDYVDSPQYAANGAFLRRLLQRDGARVADLDRVFPAREFIDNDHLTAAGQRRLAAFLERLLHQP